MNITPVSNANAALNTLNPLEESSRSSSRASENTPDKAASASGSAAATAGQVNDRTTFSSKFWNPQESIDFSMETYTRNGTRIQVEAGQHSFTMGHFANKGPFQNSFQLAGARAPLDMSVTFTTADGKVATHKLTESSVFHETEDGMIVEGRGRANAARDPDDPTKMIDENNIIFNMDDKSSVIGGNGDDVLLNFGAEAWVNGQQGNDTIVNMGDKATLKGGEGNDLIKVVRDVIREEKKSTVDLDKVAFDGLALPALGGKAAGQVADLYAPAMVGYEGGAEVNVDAGDGDDVIDSRDAKLERASVDGGNGDDLMLMDTLVSSTVKGGDGNDEIHADNMLKSTVNGGGGDDLIDIRRMKQSTVDGGSGNDNISVDHMVESHVLGGAGDDTIDVGNALRSTISGGQGDDTISLNQADNTLISGDAGNDTIAVKSLRDSTVDGGEGDDTITVGTATTSPYGKSAILGGSGNDTIQVGAAQGTVNISGGAEGENDTIIMMDQASQSSRTMQAGVKVYESIQERLS